MEDPILYFHLASVFYFNSNGGEEALLDIAWGMSEIKPKQWVNWIHHGLAI